VLLGPGVGVGVRGAGVGLGLADGTILVGVSRLGRGEGVFSTKRGWKGVGVRVASGGMVTRTKAVWVGSGAAVAAAPQALSNRSRMKIGPIDFMMSRINLTEGAGESAGELRPFKMGRWSGNFDLFHQRGAKGVD